MKNSGLKNGFKYVLIMSSLLLISSCCKCPQESSSIHMIHIRNYHFNAIQNPYILYFNGTEKIDSIPLSIVENSIYNEGLIYNLRSSKELNTDFEWRVFLNDTIQHTLDNFVSLKSEGCCKGDFIQSYTLDGNPVESSYIAIEK